MEKQGCRIGKFLTQKTLLAYSLSAQQEGLIQKTTATDRVMGMTDAAKAVAM